LKLAKQISFTLFLLVALFNFNIIAQTDSSYLQTEEILDDILQEPAGESDNSDLYDQLEQLLLNPINLNKATLEDLLQIPELDISSARLILDHRKRYGNFFSLSELNAVPNLDRNLIKKITPFLFVEKKQTEIQQESDNFGTVISKSDVLLRSRFINELQNNEGFLENKFVGTKPRVYNRILAKYDYHFQAGYLAEKDPGESEINEFSTFHIAFNDIGFLYKAVLMDYFLEFGQGLTFWTPYAFPKGADAVYPVIRSDRIIRPYTSSTENNFFRGTAAAINIGNFLLSGFYSFNYFDANIDSITGEITSTPIDGLHRTPNEIRKRKSASEKMFGGRMDYRLGNYLNLGVLYYHSSFSNPFQSSEVFDISGNEFDYSSFSYNLFLNRFIFSGEFSYNGISVASINIFQILLSKDFTFITSFRNYPRNFYSLHGYGFGERNGATNNEVGIYTGIKWRTHVGLLNFYYDQFKFPFATFSNPTPSNGDEYLLDFLTKPIRKVELRTRYKYENKDVPVSIDNLKQAIKRLRQVIRGEIIYSVSNRIRLRGRFEYNSFRISQTGGKENGYLIFQDVRYSPTDNFNLYGRIIFFKTDSFNSAIYEYENNLTGVLTNIALFGQGIRWYLLMRFRPYRVITLSLKYSETYKPEEISLGSGDNSIPGNTDNIVSLQLDLNL
jgi:hypothetical protein